MCRREQAQLDLLNNNPTTGIECDRTASVHAELATVLFAADPGHVGIPAVRHRAIYGPFHSVFVDYFEAILGGALQGDIYVCVGFIHQLDLHL